MASTFPCTDDPNEIIEGITQTQSDAEKFSQFVNGGVLEEVQLGEGQPTPTLRNVVHLVKSAGATLDGADVSGKSADAANGGTTLRTLSERFGDFVNVKDFGAVGDGVADDTAAWTAWQTALESGGMGYIPSGDYLVDGTVKSFTHGCIGNAGDGFKAIKSPYTNRYEYAIPTGQEHMIEDLRAITVHNSTEGKSIAPKISIDAVIDVDENATPVTREGIPWADGGTLIGATHGILLQHILTGGNVNNRLHCACLSTHAINDAVGRNDCGGVAARATKTSDAGIGDTCALGGRVDNYSEQRGGVMGAEMVSYNYVEGVPRPDDYGHVSTGRWVTPLHVIPSAKKTYQNYDATPATAYAPCSPVTAGILMQGSGFGAYDGIQISRSVFAKPVMQKKYVANGSTSTFRFPFDMAYSSTSLIAVFVDGVQTNNVSIVETQLSNGKNVCDIVFSTPPANGKKITIKSGYKVYINDNRDHTEIYNADGTNNVFIYPHDIDDETLDSLQVTVTSGGTTTNQTQYATFSRTTSINDDGEQIASIAVRFASGHVPASGSTVTVFTQSKAKTITTDVYGYMPGTIGIDMGSFREKLGHPEHGIVIGTCVDHVWTPGQPFKIRAQAVECKAATSVMFRAVAREVSKASAEFAGDGSTTSFVYPGACSSYAASRAVVKTKTGSGSPVTVTSGVTKTHSGGDTLTVTFNTAPASGTTVIIEFADLYNNTGFNFCQAPLEESAEMKTNATIFYNSETYSVAMHNFDSNFGIVAFKPNNSNSAADEAYFQPGLCTDYDNNNAAAISKINLGSGARRWETVYAKTSSFSESDERVKQDVADIPEAVLRAWGRVDFKQFKFIESVQKKGQSARLHVGVIAQRVVEAFEAEGVDAFEYGLIGHDVVPAKEASWNERNVEHPADYDDDGSIVNPAWTETVREMVSPAEPAVDIYSIRYEEALALECAYQRWRLEQIEARLGALDRPA